MRDVVGGQPMPWYVPSGPEDNTLVFESRFESGNLLRAIQVRPAPCTPPCIARPAYSVLPTQGVLPSHG